MHALRFTSTALTVIAVLALVSSTGCQSSPTPAEESAANAEPAAELLYRVTVPHPIEAIEALLTAAAKEQKFGVLGARNLSAALRDKGQTPSAEYWVFDVCNPVHAAHVLATNADILSVLPCKIAAIAETGAAETELIFVRPSATLGMFQTPELQETAETVEAAMIAMVQALAAPE